jgi:hypothetical protein
MSNSLLTNVTLSDQEFRNRLYSGDLITYSPRPAMKRFGQHARNMIEEVFGDLDPRLVQFSMPVEEYVKVVADLKPKFIHHRITKTLLQSVLAEYGCDLEKTYFDVPRLRMVTSDGYLTTGVGYAHHPHRDTWYSAPFQQVNWWLPLYDISPENTIAFHPYYWDQPVKNGSSQFNYYHWNGLRKNVAQHVGSDTRFQPKPEEPLDHFEPALRIVVPQDGVIIFSGAALHSTVPNTSGVTRYSIDFRTINFDDVVNRRGAPNVDSLPQGTSLRDFMHAVTLERLPDDVVQQYETAAPAEGVLVFIPENAEAK